MSEQYKIIFAGSVGAGKTTAIAQLSDDDLVTTEQRASDDVKLKKQHTTVAMDYGSVQLENGDTLHLYGTPGQKRFESMWQVLADGCMGLVILIDHSSKSPLEDLTFFLEKFTELTSDCPIVVGLTHMTRAKGPSIDEYQNIIFEKKLRCAVFEVDARKLNDVITLLKALLYCIDAQQVG
ncbi:GTP-binding protein [Agarilytica rhodophyticola]|uniref:GTP-binding protein n=1 Tax=Agarilytica rhodophyticola TaxID=1737490 RepID=UPI000B341273|nr:ATP/GTP-binding protein [Agarilytica rhodophyticola]